MHIYTQYTQINTYIHTYTHTYTCTLTSCVDGQRLAVTVSIHVILKVNPELLQNLVRVPILVYSAISKHVPDHMPF